MTAAPPCGTATAARDRPVPLALRHRGAPNPPPLRSAEHPWGLPHLTGINATKVKQANLIYEFILECIGVCDEQGTFWAVENPRNSYLWKLPGFQKLIDESRAKLARPNCSKGRELVVIIDFQQCNHGGLRDKWSRWLSNMPELLVLEGECRKNHDHLPWSLSKVDDGWLFASASEAEYPNQLCKLIAEITLAVAEKEGYTRTPDSLLTSSHGMHSIDRLLVKASIGKQAKGRRLPPIIQEYKEIIAFDAGPNDVAHLKLGFVFKKQVMLPFLTGSLQHAIPEHAKILRCQALMRVINGAKQEVVHLIIGIPWSPTEFLEQANLVSHPYDAQPLVQEQVARNILSFLLAARKQ